MSGFMPHGNCFLWHPDILTLHVASDSLIALAYFCIPLLMLRYVRSRPALWPLAGCFGIFIVSCGLTHVMDVWTIWHADYWIAGGIKAICAAASVGTALALLPFMPISRALDQVQGLAKDHDALQSQYRRIVETTSEGVWLFDAQGCSTLVSDHLADMFGYTVEEMSGRPLYDFMDGEMMRTALLPFERQVTSTAIESEFRFLRKDGSALWAELHFNAMRDADGIFVGALAMVVDVSERRAARIMLEASERRYRSLTQAMPQMVWTADRAGNVDFCNESWQCYTGMTFEAGADRVWAAVLHAHDLARFLDAWQFSLRNGRLHEIEYRMLRALDGTYRWHIGRVTPIRNEAGEIAQWIGSCTDINDYKVASQAREVLDTIGHIVLIRNDAGELEYASPHWGRYTGSNPESVLDYRWRPFIHPDNLELVDMHIAEGRELGLEAQEYEIRLRGKDGQYRWFLARTAVLPAVVGAPRRWLMTLTDIEELKQTQDALARDIEMRKQGEALLSTSHAAALAATEAKSQFLATMSHEIRTPMNGVVGMSEVLLLMRLDDEARECARVIRDSGRSLIRVLDDVLDYSKVEAGKLDLEFIDFRLANQIDSVVKLLGPQCEAKGVSLNTFLDATIPEYLSGDPGRIRQVLFNLVGNALKFTPVGGRVSIQVVRAPDPQGGLEVVPVRFTVEDTGIGIAADAIDRLFQPFAQADGSTTRRFGGTGLGLAISAQLVALMNGNIGVKSAPGTGSSFWFVIPFRRGQAVQVYEAPAVRHPPGHARKRPEKILVVDDNQVNVLVARKQLAQLGFEISEVSNGREAVEVLKGEHFDLIFMDCHMPEMDGFEATAEIRAGQKVGSARVPIVAMTADARKEDQQRCLAAGMNDYISKPTSINDLQAVVDRWIPETNEGVQGS